MPPDNSSDPLSELLHEWPVDDSAPGSFQAEVWEGILAREEERRASLLGRLERLFGQRAFQSAATAVVVLLGIALGFAKAHSKQAAIEKRRLAEARLNYLEWVSPFALLGSLDDTGESE